MGDTANLKRSIFLRTLGMTFKYKCLIPYLLIIPAGLHYVQGISKGYPRGINLILWKTKDTGQDNNNLKVLTL